MKAKSSHGFQSKSMAPQESCVATPMVVEPLTDTDAIASLLFMIEEEKMAMDVYETLYAQTGLAIFDKIASSEERHMDSLIKAASALGVDTSSLSTEAGVFTNEEIGTLYTTLITQAALSTENALAVGALIEETDIADLQTAIAQTDVVLLGQVYSNLLNGSEHHLNAFEYYL
jgi:hypothetical protein